MSYTLKYILKRVLMMLMTFFIIMLICFVLVKLLPLPESAKYGVNAEIIQKSREARGYNKPILIQFFIFWKRIFMYGDWGLGEEYKVGKDVWDTFTGRLPNTMMVNLYAILFSIPIGILLGVYAALRKNKWQDHVISTLIMVVVSVPSFVYAFLIQHIFYYKLGWFPPLMASVTENGYFSWEMFRSIIMPVMALSFGTIAGFARVTRAELTEVLTSEYMLLARAKGLSKGQAVLRHALKNCGVIIIPAIFGEFIGIMSGSLIIENMFSIPGVGTLYLDSITALDYNFFMLLSAFYTFIGLAAGIVVDISYGLIDPRIRMGAK